MRLVTTETVDWWHRCGVPLKSACAQQVVLPSPNPTYKNKKTMTNNTIKSIRIRIIRWIISLLEQPIRSWPWTTINLSKSLVLFQFRDYLSWRLNLRAECITASKNVMSKYPPNMAYKCFCGCEGCFWWMGTPRFTEQMADGWRIQWFYLVRVICYHLFTFFHINHCTSHPEISL